jgi:hypothetical protein
VNRQDLPLREPRWNPVSDTGISPAPTPDVVANVERSPRPKIAIAVATLSAWLAERRAATWAFDSDASDTWIAFTIYATLLGLSTGLLIRWAVKPTTRVAHYLVVAGWLLGFDVTTEFNVEDLPASVFSAVALAASLHDWKWRARRG